MQPRPRRSRFGRLTGIYLVVKKDRTHRNARNFYEMVDELRAHGKQFASVEESIDTTTAMGWAFIGISLRSGPSWNRTRFRNACARRRRRSSRPIGLSPLRPMCPPTARQRRVDVIRTRKARTKANPFPRLPLTES